MTRKKIEKFSLPAGHERLLLLSCCTPCACGVMEMLSELKIPTTVLFYNPNIQPQDEYELRKAEHKRYALAYGLDFVDLDYDTKSWFDAVKGFENEPERGKRCSLCFKHRLFRTAKFAMENNYTIIADVLGVSRWKDMSQVHQVASEVMQEFSQLTYLPYNWRKQGGSQRMVEIAKAEQFYRQNYCGCIYSARKI